MSRLVSAAALCVVLCLLASSITLAEDKPKAKEPPAPAKEESSVSRRLREAKQHPPLRVGEAAIEKALDEPTEFEFVEAPIGDVIDYLKDHHRIEIQIDNKAIGDVGIGTDTPVTKNLKGVSLRSALNLMLREMDLTWIIQDEVLLLTTPEEAESRMTTKVYDVGDLIECRGTRGELWNDYDSLIEVISSTLLPTTWDVVGGPGSIAFVEMGGAKAIAVQQTYDGHRQIAELLRSIRSLAKKNPEKGPPFREKPSDSDGASGRKSMRCGNCAVAAGQSSSKEEESPKDRRKPAPPAGGGQGMF